MAREKRFPPTTKRLRKAVDEGDVPASRIFQAAAQITICLPFCFYLLAGMLWEQAARSKTFVTPEDFDTKIMLISLANGLSLVVVFCLKSGCFISFCGVFAALALRGFRFGFVAPKMSLKAFDLGYGVRQMFGIHPGQAGASSVIVSMTGRIAQPAAVAGLLILGSLIAVRELFSAPFVAAAVQFAGWHGHHSYSDLQWIYPEFAGLVLNSECRLLWPIFGVCLIAGAADAALARSRWRRRLGMDEHELKDELREQEGNPAVIGARRQLHRELALHDLIENVRNSDVVVVSSVER